MIKEFNVFIIEPERNKFYFLLNNPNTQINLDDVIWIGGYRLTEKSNNNVRQRVNSLKKGSQTINDKLFETGKVSIDSDASHNRNS
eukprot:snap_masked-scaffold_61-processed-gene-0.37-mRNA-1 protein AED:1.00 eAED:1.00 QI:0/0/0/0/1/1/2/0/85